MVSQIKCEEEEETCVRETVAGGQVFGHLSA